MNSKTQYRPQGEVNTGGPLIATRKGGAIGSFCVPAQLQPDPLFQLLGKIPSFQGSQQGGATGQQEILLVDLQSEQEATLGQGK
jgi:hypothetical protein